MRDIRPAVDDWLRAGESVALATVVRTWGSAPRPVGAKLALTAGGGIAGSVSGGCVEAAVIEAGGAVIATGTPQLLTFGVADEAAWSVGLACGGEIAVWVERLDPAVFAGIATAMDRGASVAIGTVVEGSPDVVGSRSVWVEGDGGVWSKPLLAAMSVAARSAMGDALRAGVPQTTPLPSPTGDPPAATTSPATLFVDVFAPPVTLVIVGAVHIAQALVALARQLTYGTVVIDPRATFASRERFPDADEIVVDWPEPALARLRLTRSTAIAVLSHDPKIDDPALVVALRSRAFYVGALGSTKTQAARRQRLATAGVDAVSLARLHGPIGLDIGARSAEEIALAVLGEVVGVKNGAGKIS